MVVITDRIFEAFLKCKTKGYFISDATANGNIESSSGQAPSRINELYRERCKAALLRQVDAGRQMLTPQAKSPQQQQFRIYFDQEVTTSSLQAKLDALKMRSPGKSVTRGDCIPLLFINRETITRNDKLLVGFYAIIMGLSCGENITHGGIVHGNKVILKEFKVQTFAQQAASMIEDLRNALELSKPPPFIPTRHCPECEFNVRCRTNAITNDDIALLGGLKSKEITKFRQKGIATITQLSHTFKIKRKSKRIRTNKPKFQPSLKAMAIRDKTIYFVDAPKRLTFGTPVFLDVEGLPDENLYYLVGILVANHNLKQHSFWADKEDEEEIIWRQFTKTILQEKDPQIIYYGNYEAIYFRKMKKRYGFDPGTGNLIQEIFDRSVNLLSFIHGNVYFPTYSNGLKEIASYLGFKWSTKLSSGHHSIEFRRDWHRFQEDALKQELITYNTDDCKALRLVTDNIEQLLDCSMLEAIPGRTRIETLRPTWSGRWGVTDFISPELKKINRCAYWDYQRDRVYVRSSPRVKGSLARKSRQKRKNLRINKVNFLALAKSCPRCASTRIRHNGRCHKLNYDIKFIEGGIKRWVTSTRTSFGYCKDCKEAFSSKQEGRSQARYGRQITSYIIYNLIQLHISQYKLAGVINKLFNYPLCQQTINRIKKRSCEYYQDTIKKIENKLTQGHLVHADETRVGIKGKGSYVWAFTSMEEVVYIWSETREGKIAYEFLKTFDGVLVSDFYAAYDSIECKQQKCLIHLIRDLNECALKDPFNEELRRLARGFGDLLRPIVATIDRFGLKKRVLNKHRKAADEFCENVLRAKYKTDRAKQMQLRITRNSQKLFTFLEHDDVPWNNNNAEHAIKAFARLRDVIDCHSNETGMREYLALLGISQTCEYRGIDFLDFLRSGETDIDAFARPRGGRSSSL